MAAALAERLAGAGSNSTMASAPSAPFLVAPKDSAVTPAFQVISAGLQSRLTSALAKRAPSMCSGSPASRQTAPMARSSSSV